MFDGNFRFGDLEFNLKVTAVLSDESWKWPLMTHGTWQALKTSYWIYQLHSLAWLWHGEKYNAY